MGFERTPENDVRLQLQEYATEVYDVTSANDQDSEPDTLLPDPRAVTAVEFFEVFPLVRTVNGVEQPYLSLIWNPVDGDTNVETYVVQWRIATGQAWNVIEFSAASPTGRLNPFSDFRIQDIDVLPGQTYILQLYAINRLGIAGEVAERTIAIADPTPALVPTALRASAVASGIQLAWTNASDFTSIHRIAVRRQEPPTGSPGANFNESVPAGSVNGQSFTDTVPVAGRLYHYWIQSVTGSGGASAWVGPATLTAGLPEYADNAAALAGGLIAGDQYQDSSGNVRVVA
jgi:hypothetical protein